MLISGQRCLVPFLNLIIYRSNACFLSPGCVLPIKHIIQVVTLLHAGLLTFQPSDVGRGSDNFVGMHQVVELLKMGSDHRLISLVLFHPEILNKRQFLSYGSVVVSRLELLTFNISYC